MNQSNPETVGVDISKDNLDVYIYPGGETKRFANEAKGHKTLIAWLKGHQLARIVFEATGAYHKQFERTLAKAGLPMSKINPRQARRFAEATGKIAKTDAIDAAMLARFGALLEPQVRQPVNEIINEMKELTNAAWHWSRIGPPPLIARSNSKMIFSRALSSKGSSKSTVRSMRSMRH